MPIGLTGIYRPDEENYPGQVNPASLQLPTKQVDPYMRTLLKLQDSGLLTQKFVQGQIGNPLLRQDFLDSGVVGPRQPFGPGQAGLTQEELQKLGGLRRNVALRQGDKTTFIPREHTEPSGWIKLLEVFGAFNFAVAGASNALVNLYQGKTEETNPFVEAYRGFTLKDKEIFGDVLENLGWEGEDGFAYWSRESLGFVMDVVLDPINFISLGSPQAAKLARGIATKVPLRGKAVMGATTIKPMDELGKISSKIVEEGLEKLQRGEAFILGSSETQRRARALEDAVKRSLDPTVSVDDIAEGMGSLEVGLARMSLEDGVNQEVQAVLSMLARHNDPRTLRKLLEESGGGSQELRRWLSALGGDPTGEITGDILRHFLRMEGEDLTEEAITKFLTTSGGIKKLIDPGGLQLRIPFTDKGFVIAEAQWLDGFALKVEEGIVKALGVAATFTPQPIRKAVSYAAEGIAARARKGAHSISRAFGVNGRRSGILNSLLKNRDTNLKNSQSKSEERAQEILTWKIDGKESPLPEDLHEVLVDTILAEQDLAYKHIEEGHRFFSEATARKRIEVLRETNTPESLAEAARIEGSITPLGYTETVIPKIGDDPRLVGRSGEEITELERIARSVHEVFAEQYDAAVDAGVHIQFMDYYLPVQYSNWSSVKNVQLSTGNEIARVAGEDVFARARTITKEEADRLGLKVDKNLYSLVYNRLFQGKRTQIERMFVAKMIEQIAVHPGQIGEVLRKLYGPGSRESQEMLDILLKQSDYTELLNEDNLQVLIPGLDQFRNYIQTGRLDDAARWIEVNEDLVPLLASGSGRTGFFEAVQNDLQQTLGTLKDWTDSLMTTERGFLAAEEKLFTAIESSLADLDWLRIEGEALSIPDLDPAAAVGAAVRSILKERIAVLLPDVDLGSLSPIELLKRIPGESSWINLPATAGQDSGKLAILMNALDDSTEAGDKIKNKLLQKAPQLEQTLQEIAEDLVETILDSRRLTDNSVVTARMEEQLLEMALSSLPGAALERVAGRSVIITRGVNEAAVSNKLQELLELELAEKFDEMADLTDELVTQYARHPEIHEWYNNWRKSHDLPPDPSIPNLSDRVELKSRIISSMREAKEHAHRSGMSMFRLPVYAAGPQLPAGRAQRSAIEKMKQTIRRELGDDGHRFQEMLNEMMQPSVSMPGYHYSPLRATRNSVLNLYANEGSSVLNLIVDISKKLDPHEVVREVFAEKLKWGGLVRSLVGQPERLKGILEKLSQSTTNRLTSAISQIPGAQLDEAQSLIVKLEADLTDLLGSRWETGTTLTDVHLQVEATFAQFSEGLERILPTEEGRLLMFAGIDEMKTALIDSNQKTIRLYQRARELSQTITELSQNPAAILGEATETVLKSVDELVALRDEIQAALNSADEATSQLLQPNNPLPDGWAQILPEQEISNALLGEAKVLYNDMAGVFGESQELLDAFRTSQLEIAKNKRAAAAAALAGIDRDLIPVESAVNDVIMQVEYVRQATGVQKRALARLGDIQTALDAGGDLYSRNQQDMLRSFLEVSIVDEFLKGGDLTPAGWAAAGERVGTQGPKKTQILKHWWKQIGDMDDVATREVFMMTQEIVTQQAPKVGDAKLYAAIHRTAFIEGPVADDIIGAAQAAFDSVDPTILEDLGVVAPEILIRAEAAARSAVGSRRSTEGLIARLAEGAFLPDGELREIAESMHYERKFIVHLVREMSAKQGVIEGLFGARSPVGRKLMQDLRGGLQNTLIQQRQVVLDTTSAAMLVEEVERLSSELVLLVATDKQKALTRLGEIVGPGADAQELIALLDTAAVELSQMPRAEQFQAMISRIRENIEGLYAPVVDLLDDTASARVLNQGGVPQVISDWMRQNDDVLSLEPQEIAILEELMEDLNGPTGSTPQPLLVQLQNALDGGRELSTPIAPELQKRAQYWLYRLGQGYGGEAVGNAGLTTNQLDGLAKGLGRYKDRTQGADAMAVANRELLGTPGGDPGTLQATREAASTKYEARAVLKSEVDMLDQVIPHMEQGTYIEDALEYTPEQAETWRGMYAIQNYLKLQVRRSEHLALTQTLNELPSRAELNYLLMRSQMEVVDDPQALAELNKLRLAGVGQGRGVMSPEQTAKLDELTATRRVAIEEAGAFVSAHGGKKVRDLLGLDFENLPIQYGTDVPVSQQFLFHVDEFARQLPDDMSNMAGSEGAKIVQEVDGRLVVAETVEAAGVKTDANRDLVNSVAQVHDYLKLVEETGGNLSRVPALELQKRQLNFALRRFFPDEAGSASLEKRKLLLQAVVGHQNINRLDAAEASTVLRFLQTNLDPMVNEFGEKSLAAIQSAELQLLGLKSRGLLPKKLEEKYRRGLLTDDELLVEFSKLPSIEGGVEHPVMLRFPGMLDQTDPRYGQVDLTWGMGSTKEKRGLGQSVIVPKWMQDAIEDSVSPEREIGPVARGMFRVVDTFTNTFKWAMTLPWPAFHFRNVLDATARTFLALGVKGLSPTWNRNVLEIMRSNPAAKMTIRGVEYDAKTLLNMFEDLGGQVDFAQKIGQTALKMDVGDPRVLSPLSDNFVMKGANALADTAATIAGKGDNFFRLSIWLDSMEKGMGATGAMHYAQKFLFDYAHGLTPFERNFMRRLVPFYTFSRFNVPLQLELMFKQPGLISAMGKTQNLFSESRKDPIEDLLPSYIREQWRFGPTIEDGQLKIWSGRNLLATEELRFLGDIAAGQGVMKTTADEFFARINPMLKIPVELYVGHNMYFDTKIAEDQTIRGAVLDWPGIRDWLDMRKVKIGSGTDARVLYRVNGARYHLLNQLHFSRVYRTLVQTVGPGEQGAWQRLVPFVTGLRLTSIDLTRRLKHLESVSNFNNEKIRKALAQGDHVAAKRLAGLTERQPYQTVRLEESYEALEGIVEQTSRYP